VGFFSSLFGGASRKASMIDWAIKKLGEDSSYIGTAFKEISYDDVISYIKAKNCKVLNITKKDRGDWIEFLANVEGETYTVWLDKTFEGNGSVLTSLGTNN
jgi:hypothetical protein